MGINYRLRLNKESSDIVNRFLKEFEINHVYGQLYNLANKSDQYSKPYGYYVNSRNNVKTRNLFRLVKSIELSNNIKT